MLLIIVIAVIAIIACVVAKRFGGSKLVLQVIGDSVDILDDGTTLPSIIIHRYTTVQYPQ